MLTAGYCRHRHILAPMFPHARSCLFHDCDIRRPSPSGPTRCPARAPSSETYVMRFVLLSPNTRTTTGNNLWCISLIHHRKKRQEACCQSANKMFINYSQRYVTQSLSLGSRDENTHAHHYNRIEELTSLALPASCKAIT